MMRRLLPAPLLSAAIAVMWLVLARSLEPGHILLALLLGWGAPALLAPLRPVRPRIRRPLVLLRLILDVGHDVIEANLMVFRTVMFSRSGPAHARFVHIPLELRDPSGLAALAMITTVVPGTVWCELARDANMLLLHTWHVPDEAAFVAFYKRRYEQPLIQIFES